MQIFLLTLSIMVCALAPVVCYATTTWTPLVTSADFTGIQADVLTAGGGILAVLLVIVGIGLLVKILGR
jgi:hypothetical protein